MSACERDHFIGRERRQRGGRQTSNFFERRNIGRTDRHCASGPDRRDLGAREDAHLYRRERNELSRRERYNLSGRKRLSLVGRQCNHTRGSQTSDVRHRANIGTKRARAGRPNRFDLTRRKRCKLGGRQRQELCCREGTDRLGRKAVHCRETRNVGRADRNRTGSANHADLG